MCISHTVINLSYPLLHIVQVLYSRSFSMYVFTKHSSSRVNILLLVCNFLPRRAKNWSFKLMISCGLYFNSSHLCLHLSILQSKSEQYFRQWDTLIIHPSSMGISCHSSSWQIYMSISVHPPSLKYSCCSSTVTHGSACHTSCFCVSFARPTGEQQSCGQAIWRSLWFRFSM